MIEHSTLPRSSFFPVLRGRLLAALVAGKPTRFLHSAGLPRFLEGTLPPLGSSCIASFSRAVFELHTLRKMDHHLLKFLRFSCSFSFPVSFSLPPLLFDPVDSPPQLLFRGTRPLRKVLRLQMQTAGLSHSRPELVPRPTSRSPPCLTLPAF